MMNTLESFLAPARVSDWMACAHVRRCPNWQCWWDEDSVVAASGLTEDDERNLQADKMRSKARARKLAKSRCSVFLLLIAFSRRLQTPASLHVQRVLVICHSLRRGGGDSLSRVNLSYWKCVPLRLLSAVPLHAAVLAALLPGVRKFHVWWEARWCFSWFRSQEGREKHNRPEKSELAFVICSFRVVGGSAEARTRFPKVTKKSCRNG